MRLCYRKIQIWLASARNLQMVRIFAIELSQIPQQNAWFKGPRSTDGSGDAVFYASFIAGLTAAAFASFAVTPLDGVEIVLLELSHIRLIS